jgi:CelD/BcsL family acetyltransferase involved in cellulose biosynthesis
LTLPARISCQRNVQSTIGLTVEVATSVEALRALRPDYDRLQQLSGNTLPFASHEWHVSWCNQFLERSKFVSTQPMIHIARDAERTCVAIVPFMLTQRAIGPLHVRSLDLLGADPAITEIRSSLMHPAYETRAAWAIQRELQSHRSIDWINWGTVGGACQEALAVGADLQFHETLLDYVLDLPATWQLFRAGLKRNIRESIRHCHNSLARDGYESTLRVAEQPLAVQEALTRFFALHAKRADLKGTIAHPDYFARERSRRFLQEVCAGLAIRGMVRVFELVINGEAVAARIGFLIGNSLYLYYSGFDPRWAKYGVMTNAVTEIIKYAIENGIGTINLSTGKDVSKTRWGPREIGLSQAFQVSPSPVSRLVWAGFQRAKTGKPLPQWISKPLRLGARDWG